MFKRQLGGRLTKENGKVQTKYMMIQERSTDPNPSVVDAVSPTLLKCSPPPSLFCHACPISTGVVMPFRHIMRLSNGNPGSSLSQYCSFANTTELAVHTRSGPRSTRCDQCQEDHVNEFRHFLYHTRNTRKSTILL